MKVWVVGRAEYGYGYLLLGLHETVEGALAIPYLPEGMEWQHQAAANNYICRFKGGYYEIWHCEVDS